MQADDIIRLCHEVRRFSGVANWRWKGIPVIQWEFPDIGSFARAKTDILAAITPMMVNMASDAAWQRIDGPDICEIDCNGVTFRLICKQRLAVPGRSQAVGAAQVVIRRAGEP